MKKIVEKEVLTLVKNYCGPENVDRFIADQHRVQYAERCMLSDEDNKDSLAPLLENLLYDSSSFDHLITFCKQRLSEHEYQEVLLRIGTIFSVYGELSQAEHVFNKVVKFGREFRYPEFVAEALLCRGKLFSTQGRWFESTSDLKRSRVLFMQTNNISSVAKVENIIGTSYAEQGRLKEAKSYFSKALRSSEQASQKTISGTVYMNLGIVQNIMGNPDEALNHFFRSLSLFELVGDMSKIAEVHHNIGMAHYSNKEYDKAYQAFDRSLECSTKLQNPALLGLSKLGKANIYLLRKDHKLALMLCNQALEHFSGTADRLSVADAYKVKGMILRETHEYDLALTHFHSSLRINEEHNNLLNLGETYYEIGVLETTRAQHREAVAAFKHALKFFKKVGAAMDIERTNCKLTSLEKN